MQIVIWYLPRLNISLSFHTDIGLYKLQKKYLSEW